MARVRVCALKDLPEGGVQIVRHGGDYIAVFHREGKLYALDDTCPHMGGSLGTGYVSKEGTVTCPWHGWEFRICDGEGVWPQGIQIRTFPVLVEEGEVFVLLDEKGTN